MSSARIRKCPVCSVPTILESGCNKMTCSQCRTLWCYICKEKAASNHWHLGGCPLYTKTNDITDRGVVEAAGNQAANKYSDAQEMSAVTGLVQKIL
mmetsp:Transcript_42962/g.100856  ORF Transcript_42962/g.100856 Transcript_42962/m.100856 type:complete len:96 (-) Transcript_42962:9-296(-)